MSKNKYNINYSLSSNDLTYMTNKYIKKSFEIIQYINIENYESIEEIFKNKNIIYLLIDTDVNIQNNSSYGHWVVLFKRKNHIYFFCSYGKRPLSDHIQYVNFQTFKNFYNQDFIYLNKLLYEWSKKNNNKVFYNEHILQKQNMDITTCGRWCFYFIFKMNEDKNMNENKFYNLFKNVINKDILITIITNKYLIS